MKNSCRYLLVLIISMHFTMHAQYSKLMDFQGLTNGQYPYGDLYSDGTFLYGMTRGGGQQGMGVIFKIKTDGTAFSKLYDFGSTTGMYPCGNVISDGTYLYGLTSSGGANGKGIVFKIKPDGTGFTNLFDFAGISNGGNPFGSLYFDGTFLYGMTQYGGSNDLGVIFKIKTDGTGFVKLLDFTNSLNGGYYPWGSFISDGIYLYGMTNAGGSSLGGTIFKIMSDGTNYTKLYNFSSSSGTAPRGALLLDGTYLFGLTRTGGTSNAGTLFKIKTDGTGFAKLLDFDNSTNGGNSSGSLITDGLYLYGMGTFGGTSSMGVVFKIMQDGTNYTKLFDFAGSTSGREPWGSLISDGVNMYGMTWKGGLTDSGVLFKLQGVTTNVQNYQINQDIIIYPTPSSGFLNISVSDHAKEHGLIVKIKNVLAQNIKEIQITSASTTIDIGDLSSGVYYYQVDSPTTTLKAGKIIKN